jgi:hypothetical protein
MRIRAFVPLLALGLGLSVLAAVAAPPVEKAEKPDADKIAKMIAQLGSDSFDEREKASADLEAVGDAALDALREALKSSDEEIHKRAEVLVGKIDRRLDSAAALKPKHVHLVYKDTPLAEALDDFKKQSGYNLALSDPNEKLKDRKITLDTGDVTFWQALDQFCDGAGLQESDDPVMGLVPHVQGPLPPGFVPPKPIKPKSPIKDGAAAPPARQTGVVLLAAPPPPGTTTPAAPLPPGNTAPAPFPVPPIAAQRGIVFGGQGGPPGFGTPAADEITLEDGKTDAEQTDATSAVLIRAVPISGPAGAAPADDILVNLRLSIEPKMQWQSIDKVTVSKAIDDQKQELTQTAPGLLPLNPPPPGVAGRAVILPVPGPGVGLGVGGIHKDEFVYLKKGDKPSRSLAEMSGVISAHILGEAKPIITADDILKAAGKTFKGGEGGQLKITEATENTNNQVVIVLELQSPADSVPALGAGNGGAPLILPVRPVPPGGGAAVPGAAGGVAIGIAAAPGAVVFVPGAWNGQDTAGLSLLDDKGNAIPQVGMETKIEVVGRNAVRTAAQLSMLTFQAAKDQTPSKLVYSGRKVLSVDIPFTLKDVPLP